MKNIKIKKFKKGTYTVSATTNDGLEVHRTYYVNSTQEALNRLQEEFMNG